MDTGFIATTIKRIARKRIFLCTFFLTAIFIGACSLLALLLLLNLIDLIFYSMIIVGTLFVCGILAYLIFLHVHAFRNPLKSYFIKDLKQFGPLEQIIAQIDSEAAPYLGTVGTFVTKNWIISAQSNSLRFARLEDVVWVYKQLNESSVRFYYAVTVSTGRTYAAMIWLRSGVCMRVLSSEDGINRLLESIIKNVPWVSKGYLDYLFTAWYTKRADFIAAVDDRRRQVQSTDYPSEQQNLNQNQIEPSVFNQSPLTPFTHGGSRPFELDFNHPLVRAGIEESQKRENNNARAKALLLMFLGLGCSGFFSLPVIIGVSQKQSEISISTNGIILGLVFFLYGLYLIVLRPKTKKNIENILGKNLWTLLISLLLLAILFILLDYGIRFILISFGYKIASSFTP